MKIRLTFLALLIVYSNSTFANMANPMRTGDKTSEPSGELRKLHIEREDLTLDLRPVVEKNPAKIEAHYLIRNDSSERSVDLVFVGVNIEDGNYEVLFDGESVRTFVVADSTLPKEWLLPDSIENVTEVHKNNRHGIRLQNNSLRFTLVISHGNHTITVRYKGLLRHDVSRLPVITWYCDYILSPAKQWASFGSLHTTVLLPEGWEAESEPGMIRRGDSLVGEWDIIPKDILTVTVHTPITFMLALADDGIPILTLLLCVILIVRFGLKIGKRYSAGEATLSRSIFTASAVSISIPIIVLIMIGPIRSWLLLATAGVHKASSYDYGTIIGAILFAPYMVVLSFILISVLAVAKYVFFRRKVLKGI
jgi:hypothetical protein